MCGTNAVGGLNRSQRDIIRTANSGLPPGQGGPTALMLRFLNKSLDDNPLPPKQVTSSGSTGLSIQSRPSARTGSGTRVQAKAKTKARQSRTKRFTTR